jgi:hypothetical protein
VNILDTNNIQPQLSGNGMRVWSAPTVRRIYGYTPEDEASDLFRDEQVHVVSLSPALPIPDPNIATMFVITAVIQERVLPNGMPDDEDAG